MIEHAFAIGELSRRTGIQVSTIRYYEKKHLLETPSRSGGGYRLYSSKDEKRLSFIIEAKKFGFTLEEIRELLAAPAAGSARCHAYRHRAVQRLEQIEKEIRERQQFVQRIKKALADCERNQCLFNVEK